MSTVQRELPLVVQSPVPSGERDRLIRRAKALLAGSVALLGFGIDSSIVVMPLLGRAKRAVGARLGSVVALGIAALAVWEGRAAWQGESCCDDRVPA